MARTGTRGLRWPPVINERGGLDLTSPDAGGAESLRQVLFAGHYPRRSLDPFLVRESVGAPDVAFAPVGPRLPAEVREHLDRFYQRLAVRQRAQLVDGPTVVSSDDGTGRVTVRERVINLESGQAIEENIGWP